MMAMRQFSCVKPQQTAESVGLSVISLGCVCPWGQTWLLYWGTLSVGPRRRRAIRNPLGVRLVCKGVCSKVCGAHGGP